MMRALYLTIAAIVAAGTAHAQGIQTPADAFNAGKDFANTGKGAAGNLVNSSTGSQQLPHYGTTAPETANFQGGKNLIGAVGTNKQTTCETYKAPNAFQQQECDAVNFLSKNSTTRPKYAIDKKTDPLLTGSKTVINNPGNVPGAPTQQCRIERVKNPATFITETCTETQTLENVKCKRGFSANVGTIVDTQSFDVNRGSEVPPWTAQTFTMNFNVRGNPEGFKIAWYQIDNYGQVWVNGTKVIENVLGGYDDMRWGSVATDTEFVEDPYSDFGGWYRTVYVYKNRTGISLGSFYDDQCNWGCRGMSPNLDITPYIREGDNEIVMVCANAKVVGPCSVKITGSAKKLVMLGSLIDNQCSTLEQRAR
ncbi:conjugative transfer aggregate stability protein (plasmid) [Ralstonia pseudosolanacearum]